MQVVHIDGGLGRVICAVPAVERLAREDVVVVLSPWPEVFANNPKVSVCNSNDTYAWDDYISKGTYHQPEPYHREAYYRQQEHLIEGFEALLNGAPILSKPKLYLTEFEKSWAQDFMRQVQQKTGKRRLIAFQPYGAGHNGVDNTYRSFSSEDVTKLCGLFSITYWDAALVNCTKTPIIHPNVIQQEFTVRQLFSVVSVCDSVFCVDSSVSHIGAAFDKRGVLVLGSTYAKNVGYDNYRTFQKEGYPNGYYPIRFPGKFRDTNKGAMDWTSEELGVMVKALS